MNEEIGQAFEKLEDGDSVGFINDMKDVISTKLAENEDFIALGDELEKFNDELEVDGEEDKDE